MPIFYDNRHEWTVRYFFMWQEQSMICENLLPGLAKAVSKAKLGPVPKILL